MHIFFYFPLISLSTLHLLFNHSLYIPRTENLDEQYNFAEFIIMKALVAMLHEVKIDYTKEIDTDELLTAYCKKTASYYRDEKFNITSFSNFLMFDNNLDHLTLKNGMQDIYNKFPRNSLMKRDIIQYREIGLFIVSLTNFFFKYYNHENTVNYVFLFFHIYIDFVNVIATKVKYKLTLLTCVVKKKLSVCNGDLKLDIKIKYNFESFLHQHDKILEGIRPKNKEVYYLNMNYFYIQLFNAHFVISKFRFNLFRSEMEKIFVNMIKTVCEAKASNKQLIIVNNLLSNEFKYFLKPYNKTPLMIDDILHIFSLIEKIHYIISRLPQNKKRDMVFELSNSKSLISNKTLFYDEVKLILQKNDFTIESEEETYQEEESISTETLHEKKSTIKTKNSGAEQEKQSLICKIKKRKRRNTIPNDNEQSFKEQLESEININQKNESEQSEKESTETMHLEVIKDNITTKEQENTLTDMPVSPEYKYETDFKWSQCINNEIEDKQVDESSIKFTEEIATSCVSTIKEGLVEKKVFNDYAIVTRNPNKKNPIKCYSRFLYPELKKDASNPAHQKQLVINKQKTLFRNRGNDSRKIKITGNISSADKNCSKYTENFHCNNTSLNSKSVARTDKTPSDFSNQYTNTMRSYSSIVAGTNLQMNCEKRDQSNLIKQNKKYEAEQYDIVNDSKHNDTLELCYDMNVSSRNSSIFNDIHDLQCSDSKNTLEYKQNENTSPLDFINNPFYLQNSESNIWNESKTLNFYSQETQNCVLPVSLTKRLNSEGEMFHYNNENSLNRNLDTNRCTYGLILTSSVLSATR